MYSIQMYSKFVNRYIEDKNVTNLNGSYCMVGN